MLDTSNWITICAWISAFTQIIYADMHTPGSLSHSQRRVAPNHWCLGNIIFLQVESFIRWYVLPFFHLLLLCHSQFFFSPIPCRQSVLLQCASFYFNERLQNKFYFTWMHLYFMFCCTFYVASIYIICIFKNYTSPRRMEKSRKEKGHIISEN